MEEYDYLIVGAGLFGATFAYQAKKAGKKCLVIDKRSHVAGNAYTKPVHGINVHEYGAHIFHTSDKRVWDFVNRFAEFNNYINSPLAFYRDETYNLPFNMNTFSRMWNIRTPREARDIIAKQISSLNITNPKNLEEQALSLVGTDVYEKLIKGYTEKQWGRPCTELPPFIIKRIPLRFTYNNNYFNDRYQGIPIGGYTRIADMLLDGVDVKLNEDFGDMKQRGMKLSDGTAVAYRRLIYTGPIDEYFGYADGPLQYRSVRFETEELPVEDFQGNAVVNYTDAAVPFTRIIEHKHFENNFSTTTIISREYSSEWKPGVEPYYPVNDAKNTDLLTKYQHRAAAEKDVVFGGRLGQYRYYNMDQVIGAALDLADSEF